MKWWMEKRPGKAACFVGVTVARWSFGWKFFEVAWESKQLWHSKLCRVPPSFENRKKIKVPYVHVNFREKLRSCLFVLGWILLYLSWGEGSTSQFSSVNVSQGFPTKSSQKRKLIHLHGSKEQRNLPAATPERKLIALGPHVFSGPQLSEFQLPTPFVFVEKSRRLVLGFSQDEILPSRISSPKSGTRRFIKKNSISSQGQGLLKKPTYV